MENINVDFSKIKGRFKPINGVGNGPVSSRFLSDRRAEFINAKIPFSRLHDTEGKMGSGEYVNIHCIFKNFDADENDPANYSFKNTDLYIQHIIESKIKVFYRLGETIENNYDENPTTVDGKTTRVGGMRNHTVVPKDFNKWARICEHIIRHYNEGWADGFNWGLEYFEIWNEPDGAPCWSGTPEQYYELYSVTANHLKKCFGDTIKVGGFASTGFHELFEKNGSTYALDFAENFLKYIKGNAPLDFFSWHCYTHDTELVVKEINYCRELLNKYGFNDTPSILDEWNLVYTWAASEGRMRKTMQGAAYVAAILSTLQKEAVDMAMYYDAEIRRYFYCGLFTSGKAEPEKPYYEFMIFRYLSDLENEVSTSENKNGIYTLASAKDDKAMLAVTNFDAEDTLCKIDISGLKADKNRWYEILLLDEEHTLVPVRQEQLTGNTIMLELKKNTSVLITINSGFYRTLETVQIDFNKKVKKFNEINGVGNGPVGNRFNNNHIDDFKEVEIPFSRLHDTEGQMGSGEFVNIHCIFKNFDADENDPANYNFKSTDLYIKYILETGTKVLYRFGETIENNSGDQLFFNPPGLRNYTVVPKDFNKWARICEHIIRHYNEGWADGFNWGLEYFEIWNEPENMQNWDGTEEQYIELYKVTANHLKNCFGNTIKVGGPGACMIYEALDERFTTPTNIQLPMYNNFTEKFLKEIKDKAPLDFFTWHGYCTKNPKKLEKHITVTRELLDFYGFDKTESICDEWNVWGVGRGLEVLAYRKGIKAAAFIASAFTVFQQKGLDKAMYYDAEVTRSSFCGLFDEYEDTRLKPYYAFSAYNEVKKGVYELVSSCNMQNIYVLASDKAIMLSRVDDNDTFVTMLLGGLNKPCKAEICVLDDERNLEAVRTEYFTNKNGKLSLNIKGNAVVLLKLSDI